MILAIVLMKKRLPVIISLIIVMILIASLCIVMPMIFGAGLGEILFVWAPYSLAGSMAILAICVMTSIVKLWKIRSNEN